MEIISNSVALRPFFMGGFNVDSYLATYTKVADLEAVRNELKVYGQNLKDTMQEMLQADTEAIVQLAEFLTLVEKKLTALKTPIYQLNDQISTLYKLIKTAEANYNRILLTLENTKRKRASIDQNLILLAAAFNVHVMMSAEEERRRLVKLDVLERVVNKYAFDRNCVALHGEFLEFTTDTIKQIDQKLVQLVNLRFLEGVNNNEPALVTTCLRMYDNLGMIEEAYTCYRQNVVKPRLERLVSERYLVNHNGEISDMYHAIVEFLNEDMQVLYVALQPNPHLKFNFVYNCLWKELDERMREGLHSITAAGNPDLFQARYIATWKLFQKIATKAGNPKLITEDESFQNHMKRFNLPVYFEIRYQQFAGAYESTLMRTLEPNLYSKLGNEYGLTLKGSIALWKTLQKMLSNNVYIPNCSEYFVKLSMLMLSRYSSWFQEILATVDQCFPERENILLFMVNTMNDVRVLKELHALDLSDEDEIRHNIDHSLYRIFPKEFTPQIVAATVADRRVLDNIEESVKRYFVNMKVEECAGYLKNSEAIPRLYRSTNRDNPSVALPYVHQATDCIISVSNNLCHYIHPSQTKEIIDWIVKDTTLKYTHYVMDVMTSISRMEVSLRRLIGRKVQNNPQILIQNVTSDEGKMRKQVKADVEYYIDELYNRCSNPVRDVMDKLINAAEQ